MSMASSEFSDRHSQGRRGGQEVHQVSEGVREAEFRPSRRETECCRSRPFLGPQESGPANYDQPRAFQVQTQAGMADEAEAVNPFAASFANIHAQAHEERGRRSVRRDDPHTVRREGPSTVRRPLFIDHRRYSPSPQMQFPDWRHPEPVRFNNDMQGPQSVERGRQFRSMSPQRSRSRAGLAGGRASVESVQVKMS